MEKHEPSPPTTEELTQRNFQALNDEDETESVMEKVENVQDYDRLTINTVDLDAVTQDDELSNFELSPHDGLSPPPPTPAVTPDAGSEINLDFFARVSEVFHKPKIVSMMSENDDLDKPGPSSGEAIRKGVLMAGGSKRAAIKDEEGLDPDAVESDHPTVRIISSHTDREKEKQQESECSRYAGVERFANKFVDNIIGKSINEIIEHKDVYLTNDYMEEDDRTTLSSLRTYVEVFGSFTKWPRIQDFTRELGETMINDYMSTWDYDEEWLYCIDFLLAQSDECSDYYIYEAKWSIPSKPYPIPQATASIYFTVEVSRVKPPYCPIDVTYNFEGSRMVHTPGKISFQEHWLLSIIDAKIELYKQITF